MRRALTSLQLLASHSVLESRSKAVQFQPLLGSMYATFCFANMSIAETITVVIRINAIFNVNEIVSVYKIEDQECLGLLFER